MYGLHHWFTWSGSCVLPYCCTLSTGYTSFLSASIPVHVYQSSIPLNNIAMQWTIELGNNILAEFLDDESVLSLSHMHMNISLPMFFLLWYTVYHTYFGGFLNFHITKNTPPLYWQYLLFCREVVNESAPGSEGQPCKTPRGEVEGGRWWWYKQTEGQMECSGEMRQWVHSWGSWWSGARI